MYVNYLFFCHMFFIITCGGSVLSILSRFPLNARRYLQILFLFCVSSQASLVIPEDARRYHRFIDECVAVVRNLAGRWYSQTQAKELPALMGGQTTVFEHIFTKAQQCAGVPEDRRVPVFAMNEEELSEFGGTFACTNQQSIIVNQEALYDVDYGVVRMVALHESFHLAHNDLDVFDYVQHSTGMHRGLTLGTMVILAATACTTLRRWPHLALAATGLSWMFIQKLVMMQKKVIIDWYRSYGEYNADVCAFAALHCQECVEENRALMNNASVEACYLQPHEMHRYIILHAGKRCAYHSWLATATDSSSSTSNLNS